MTAPTTPQKNQNIALAFGISAVLLWSTVAIGFKLGLAQLSVIQLLWLGTSFSWLVFAAYAYLLKQLAINFKTLGLCILFGSINPVAYYFLLFKAYELLPAHIAQPLNYTWAIVLAALAVPILKQQLTKNLMFGIATSYLGVLVLLASPQAEDTPLNLPGVAIALLSTILWASYWLLNTKLATNIHPAKLMLYSFSWGWILLTGILITTQAFPTFSNSNLFYGAWVGLIEMGITFILWQQALSRATSAAQIGQLIFLSPFISMLLIQQFLQEKIHLTAFIGLAIIVIGLYLSNRAQSVDNQDLKA